MFAYLADKNPINSDGSEGASEHAFWNEGYKTIVGVATAGPDDTVTRSWKLQIAAEHETEISSMTSQEIALRSIRLWEITGLGKLKKPIEIGVESSEGFFVLSNEELGIVEGGNSFAEAVAEFCSFFAADYNNLAGAGERDLADDARRLRELYKTYF